MSSSEQQLHPAPVASMASGRTRSGTLANVRHRCGRAPFGSLMLETTDGDEGNVGSRPDGALFNLSETTVTLYAAVLEPTGKPSLSP